MFSTRKRIHRCIVGVIFGHCIRYSRKDQRWVGHFTILCPDGFVCSYHLGTDCNSDRMSWLRDWCDKMIKSGERVAINTIFHEGGTKQIVGMRTSTEEQRRRANWIRKAMTGQTFHNYEFLPFRY